MKQVVLVKPPETCRFNFGTFSLGTLAAAIRHLVQVSILDATNLAAKEAVQQIWTLNPDLIGVTVMGLNSVPPAVDFIRQLKSKLSSQSTTIITGGHGASMMPIRLLDAGADAVVIGEGELTLQQILETGISPGMAGVACRVDNQTTIGPPQKLIYPLDRLPVPARDLMPVPPDGIHLMETSRGCPHECGFCETTRFYRRRWRPHSATWVANEVRRLVEDYGAWIIHFADDNFTASANRALDICEQLRQGPLPVLILASARGDDLINDERLIPAMASAHILRISVGVETVEPEVEAKAGKLVGLNSYRQAFARMQRNGIFTVASFIIGLPGETTEMRQRAVDMAIETGTDSAHFLPFLPLPGTPLASNRLGYNPDPADVSDADSFNQAFAQHPIVVEHLTAAATADGIRGLLAQATLKRLSHTILRVCLLVNSPCTLDNA